MAQIVVKELEEVVKLKLRCRAARHGRSMEEEVREILRIAIRDEQGPRTGLGSRIAAHFEGKGLDTDLPELRGIEACSVSFGGMIVLDTNVLSALMQSQPDAGVVSWLDRQPLESVCITTINLFEIRYGLAQLTPGKRRKALEDAFSALLRDDLQGCVLPFDASAADHAARLAGERRRKGRPVDMRDTQIAGICEAHHATLATRNTRHFEDISTPIVNPWEDRSS